MDAVILFLKEEDWGLDDPTGKNDEEFEIVKAEIEKKIKELANKISTQKLY